MVQNPIAMVHTFVFHPLQSSNSSSDQYLSLDTVPSHYTKIKNKQLAIFPNNYLFLWFTERICIGSGRCYTKKQKKSENNCGSLDGSATIKIQKIVVTILMNIWGPLKYTPLLISQFSP